MRKILAVVISNCLIIQTAFATPALTTANVNFRQGPGTNYSSLGTVPKGSPVEMDACDDAGAWCSVTIGKNTGFISGAYLQPAQGKETNEAGWPKSYETGNGATLVLYQPQFSDWENFKTATASIAAEYIKDKKAKPVFGVINVKGATQADRQNGLVHISDITVTELNFSALGRSDLTDLTLEVGKILPTGPMTIKEERIVASLAEYKRMNDVKGLNAEAPPIFVSKTPAVLVQTDGEPIVAPVKGDSGLNFIVNTNWDILKLDDDAYYLRDQKSWLTSTNLSSGWKAVTTLPEKISKLPEGKNWDDARKAIPAQAFKDGDVPKVFYSAKPAEMIVFEGEPKLETVPGTGLEWASNTQSDVFFLKKTKIWYILVSGRWFKSASLDGPWTFTTTDLPQDFQNIPEDAPYYSVRASVPGTSESAQARLKASIPNTARVELGSVSASVSYAGEPEFKPIKGTQMTYAVNTNDQVIKVGDKYFVLQNGVWFVGDTPSGPFKIATSVPEAIYTIPASSPVYNVTYVRIYDTEPDAIWFGYTMGYLSGYLAWGTYVYGSGWYYNPWYRPGPNPIYFPRPVTYGIGAFYNPVRGVYGRYGYAYGPYRGIAGGAAYNPRTGTYVRAGAVSGPSGSRGFIAAYNPRTGNGGFIAGGHNVYGSWGHAGVKIGSSWSASRATATRISASRWSASGHAGLAGRRADVFAGQDGNVYRKQSGTWQSYNNGKWSEASRTTREKTVRSQRSVTTNTTTHRRSATEHLERDYKARTHSTRQVNRREVTRSSSSFNSFERGGFERSGGFHGGGSRGGGFHGGGFHGGGFRGGRR